MFIQTETTPNPRTMKFLPGREVITGEPIDIRNIDEARISPLASALLSVEGVERVFLGHDFISVTKCSGEWPHLTPPILSTIMEHFVSGRPILLDESEASREQRPDLRREEEFFDPKDTELVGQIKELLDKRVRPAVATDGGDIIFKGFQDGIVYLNMRGACAHCPSSTATLKYSVQNLLKYFLPSIVGVEQIEDSPSNPPSHFSSSETHENLSD